MRRYAGVIVTCRDLVLLIREPHGDEGVLHWGIPSGTVEEGETFVEGAARELAEESGLQLAASDLIQVARVELRMSDGIESTSLTFAAEVEDPHEIVIDDPDGSVQEGAWVPARDAPDLLGGHGYLSMIEPVVYFLTTEAPAVWHYTDPRRPGFRA